MLHMLNDECSGELSYLLADSDAREAVLVDPHGRDVPVWQALLDERQLRLRWVLRTHQHDALLPGEFARIARLGVPVVQGQACVGVQTVADGDLLPFGNEFLRTLRTPGHTADCLSFAWRDRVFCGGLLAVDACPHQPCPADAAALWDSVTQRIFILSDETLLYTGHDPRARAVSTVMEQRRWHPFFSRLTRDEFLARMSALQSAAVDHDATV